MQITEGSQRGHCVRRIISRWDTTHECQVCNKDFAGNNAVLVELDNEQQGIICADCAEKLTDLNK